MYRITLVLTLLCALAAAPMSCGKDSDAPLPYDDLVHACVRTTACGVKPYPRVSDCIDAYYNLLRGFGFGPIYDSVYQCINGAKSCEDMYKCFGTSQLAGSCDASYSARCDGSRAVSCDLLDKRVYIIDCSLAGLGCGVKKSNTFEASCSPGKCDAGYKRRCDGDRLLGCNDGVIVVENCAADGLVCSSEGDIPDCVGEQKETCRASQYQASCDGNTEVSCVNGRVHRRNCSDNITKTVCRGGVCVESSKSCLDDFDRCAGAKLETCIDGSWVSVNCESLGLSSCRPASNGASCGPPAL